MKSKKRKAWIPVAGVLLLVAVAVWWWQGNQRNAVPLAEQYQTVVAEPGEVARTINMEGNLRAADSVSLFVDTPQTVARVHVKEGDTVTEGDLLVEYDVATDRAELERQLSEAQLYLTNARLSMENLSRPATGNDLIGYEEAVIAAKKNLDDVEGDIRSLEAQIVEQNIRSNNLQRTADTYRDDYHDELVRQEEYDLARTNSRVAEAELEKLRVQLESKQIELETRKQQVETAEKKLENAKTPLSDENAAARYRIQQNLAEVNTLAVTQVQEDLTKLKESMTSPISGHVAKINVVEGGTAAAGLAVLELSDASAPVAKLEVGEYDAPQVKIGQVAEIVAPGLPDKVYTGKVSKIGAEAVRKENGDGDEVIVPVEITLDNLDDDLKIGYTLTVDIYLERRQDVIWVPLQAIVSEGEHTFVYAITSEILVRRQVETGFYGDRGVEILRGVEQGDLLISNPLEITQREVATEMLE